MSRPVAAGGQRSPFPFLLSVSLLLTAASSPVPAQVCERAAVEDRPRIGLALGGGGARGGAHIGVLRVLEELRVPVDYIAGTSMGSIVGALYSSGMEVDELEGAILEANWDDLFTDSTEREDRPLRRKSEDDLGLYNPPIGVGKGNELLTAGAVAGQKILFLFETLTSNQVQVNDFDQLPIPYRAVAADIVTGQMVVMDHGDVSLAMRASMSVPGVFDPVHWDEHLLVDGGIVRNLPVDVVRDMGADVVIAVNVGTLPATADELRNLVAIIGQMSSLMITANTRQEIESLQSDDILITPDLGHKISAADFEIIGDTIPIGYAAANAVRENLGQLSVTESQYRAWRAGLDYCVTGPPTIQYVRLENNSRFSDDVLLRKIHVKPGDVLDYETLDKDIRQIYALDFIRFARYRIEEEDGQKGVVIQVEPDQRGPDYIQSGIEMFLDERDSGFNIKAAYLKTDLSRRGAEARTAAQIGDDAGFFAELYYPLDDNFRWIFRPQVRYSRRELRVFDAEGSALSQWAIDEYGGLIGFGREFRRHAGLFTGVRSYAGQAKVEIGDPFGGFRYKGGEWFLGLRYDRLDDRYLPSRGSFSDLSYLKSDESLGADAEF
ncbi:MAG: patatin-like phospholipase family protein, partial [Xanthomonadales bacterium]|nr:patatin-like phospholipase family protein [Xanthomonadales bacterium]